MPKWVYLSGFLFVLWLVFGDPDGTGQVVGTFLEPVRGFFRAIGELVEGMFTAGAEQ